jgi:FkbM family methyltransferase
MAKAVLLPIMHWQPGVRLVDHARTLWRGIKQPIQQLMRSAGYDLHRLKPDDLDTLRRYTFGSVLDIGGNEGQFARRIRHMYPRAAIHSFEPIGTVFEVLSQALGADERFQAHRIALGETHGKVEIYANGTTDFSSMLPMNLACREGFPTAADETLTQVEMMPLDEWAESQTLHGPILIKIDVQGYEDRVIRGGLETVKKAAVIITEVSFTPLYESQPLFHDMYLLLHSLGFELRAVVNNMYDESKINIVQADAIFERAAACRRGVVRPPGEFSLPNIGHSEAAFPATGPEALSQS